MKISSCPFCKFVFHLTHLIYIVEKKRTSGVVLCVKCSKCEGHGPLAKSHEDAIEQWNTTVPQHVRNGTDTKVLQSPKELLRLYKDGHTLQEIGNIASVSRETIRKVLIEYGEYDPSRKSTTRKEREKRDKNILRDHNSGMGRNELSAIYNLNTPALRRILSKYGVKLRKSYKCTCDTEPYARGFCKNCYKRLLQQGVIVKKEYKCTCDTEIFAKGRCRNCYARWVRKGRP